MFQVYNVYLQDFKCELRDVVKRLNTLHGKRESENLEDNTGNTSCWKILLAVRQCVLAASLADSYAKKFLQSLQSFDGGFEFDPNLVVTCLIDGLKETI